MVTLEINGDSKAYPVAILMWHEIVNDEVGAVPMTVTFCPLCNIAIVFYRRIGDVVYDFGTSGNLRKSDLVIWGRQRESWWQQITGEAIVGELTGMKLTTIPARWYLGQILRKPLLTVCSFTETPDSGGTIIAHPTAVTMTWTTGHSCSQARPTASCQLWNE